MASRVRRVLIIDTRSLLVAGIKSVLSREPDLHVEAIAPEGEAALIEAIERSRPDTVVLDEGSLVFDVPGLLALLEEYPVFRVVVLRADNSVARIYDKQQVLLRQVSDLVTAIRRS